MVKSILQTIKTLFRGIIGLQDMVLGTLCMMLAGYSVYWLMLQPLDKPFGLVLISYASPAETKKQVSVDTISTSVSENDMLATEVDSNQGKTKRLSRGDMAFILRDKKHRVSDIFKVPADLRRRVEFWFNIYTTHTISHAVVHDNAHPWIVYKVLDLNSIYRKYRTQSKRNITKSRLIRSTRYRYINILTKLAKRKHYRRLSKSEQRVYNLFRHVKGKRQAVFARAKRMVRVQRGQKDSVLYAIKRSGRYLPMMEKIFKKHKLPVELTRIPFLESSFNINAYSKDGASGIWQFMHKTGRAFLKVSYAKGIDERNSPLKATEAAVRLLRQNFRILKSWPLAVTAYNHGPGGLLKGIRKVKSRNLNDLIERYHQSYFGFASKNFYSEFLAILHVERYQDMIFGYVKKDKLLVHDTIDIQYAMRVKFIMDLCRVSKADIQLHNPDLRNKALGSRTYLPEGYYLRLPKGKAKALKAFYKEAEEANRLLDQMLGPEKKSPKRKKKKRK